MDSLDKQFYIALGKTIKKRRNELGLSLQNVVDKLPKENTIARQTLSKYEKGNRRMNTTIFNEICKILNLSPKEILNSIKFD